MFILSSPSIKQDPKVNNMYQRYRKYPNLMRTQVEIISDPNCLVRILFEM